MEYLYALIGLFLLFVGGEGLVRGSTAIAARLGLSTLLIGVVVVGFGTSTPELIVSAEAALHGSPQIALGNVVGSNIANVLLILGVAAMITPLACGGRAVLRDALFVVVAALLLLLFAFIGELGRVGGLAMLILLASYIIYSIRSEKSVPAAHQDAPPSDQPVEPPSLSMPVAIVMTLASLALLMVGARCLIDGATTIARSFGVSDAIIGLTLVAVGTSLPELAAGAIGAIRKQTDMVVGNILGSNFYNILGILGVVGVLAPTPINGRIAEIDIPVMLAVMVATAAVIIIARQFNRVTGVVSLTLYAGYVWWMFASGVI